MYDISIYDSDELENHQQLKNRSVQIFKASNSNGFETKTLSYVRMYKRTQFSMNINISGIQQFLSSRFRPNILTTAIMLKADGILQEGESLDGSVKPIQYEEFYLPAISILNSFIYNLFAPKEMLLITEQSGNNIGGDDQHNLINIVADTYKGKQTWYPTVSMSYTQEYKLYYPAMANGHLQNKLIALQVSAQDKVYSLSKTLVSG